MKRELKPARSSSIVAMSIFSYTDHPYEEGTETIQDYGSEAWIN